MLYRANIIYQGDKETVGLIPDLKMGLTSNDEVVVLEHKDAQYEEIKKKISNHIHNVLTTKTWNGFLSHMLKGKYIRAQDIINNKKIIIEISLDYLNN